MTSPSTSDPASADQREPGHPAEADTAVSAGEALSGRESRPAGKVQTEEVDPHEASETEARKPDTSTHH